MFGVFGEVILAVLLMGVFMISAISTGQVNFAKTKEPRVNRTIFVFLTSSFAFALGLLIRYLYERLVL